MTEATKQTLNADTLEVSSGSPSLTDRPQFSPDSENLHETVEGAIPDSSSPDAKTGADAVKTETEKETGKEVPATETEAVEGDRFDKHPRFQELIQSNREYRERIAKLEGTLETMKEFAPKAEKKNEAPTFVDITTKTDDELREWMQEDPKGYNANLYAQIRHELMQEYQQARTQESARTSVQKTFDGYAEKNPDFLPMWKSGEIKRFMDENPGHNAISAHILLTAEKRKGESEKQMQERIAKAVKEAEEKVTKNFQAKKSATVLSGAPSAAPASGEDAELKDTKSRGGLVTTLTERLQRMRGKTASA